MFSHMVAYTKESKIYRTQDIFRTMLRHGIFRTLCYAVRICHIQNVTILPKLTISSWMIGSFSVSCNCFTSLTLITWEIPLKYRLITCLTMDFPLFSFFSFSSRCLYSAYVLLIVSLPALSTLSFVYSFLPPRKYAFPLLIAPLVYQ